jgi:hypothetical protein
MARPEQWHAFSESVQRPDQMAEKKMVLDRELSESRHFISKILSRKTANGLRLITPREIVSKN